MQINELQKEVYTIVSWDHNHNCRWVDLYQFDSIDHHLDLTWIMILLQKEEDIFEFERENRPASVHADSYNVTVFMKDDTVKSMVLYSLD